MTAGSSIAPKETTMDALVERVTVELPDGTPGFTAANQLIGRLARLCWDAFG